MQGKIRLFSLMFYLVTANVVFTQNKPPTAVSRTLQTQNFAADTKRTLKASINALQDLDYTIDVLNSDVGLITASRTTEQKKAEVSSDGVDPGPSSQNNKLDGEIDAEEAAKKEAEGEQAEEEGDEEEAGDEEAGNDEGENDGEAENAEN